MGFRLSAVFRRLRERGPRESFYELFVAQASIIAEAAGSLKEMVEALDEAAQPSNEERAEKIKALEERGDVTCHMIYAKLDKTFITPASLDAEDIRGLTHSLDNILDMVEKASSRLVVFGVAKASSDLVRLVTSVDEMVKSLEVTITEFGKGLTSHLGEECVGIHRKEEEVDRLYRGALMELFRRGDYRDVREIVAWKDIYEIIESAADCCHDAVVVIEAILSKNKII